jgi:hypothetical protein
MVANLEDQELVDGLQCVGIVRLDLDPGTTRRLLQRVDDRFALLFHHRDAGRHGVMDEHRNLEVICAEHGCDVDEVSSDLISGGGVLLILHVHLDNAAIGSQLKTMPGRLQREAHCVLPAMVYAGGVRISLSVSKHGTRDEAA